ncbi:MAG TPA: response regulator transcription factor [Acidimicrobiia bacterium]
MLVDARSVVRAGLCALIDNESDLVVVAQAATVRDAMGLDVTPDVIVTDIDLPDADRGEVIRRLRDRFRASSILVFTPIGHLADVQSVLAEGANGYLLETADPDDLLTGIRAVAGGKTYLQPSLSVALARLHRARDTGAGLTPQEEHVLRYLALGYTNVEVARHCGVSLRTAESHRAQLRRKLGRRTRAELVEYALEVGLVELDSS